jgi:putative FmdB family regulatory protein
MPLYEYTCSACATAFEELVFGQAAAVACPRCGSAKVERQLSVVAVGRGGGDPISAAAAPGGCGRCGDPRGPGACSAN